MASFLQVVKSSSQGRRQRWFICGSEPAVVQDMYELALAHVYSKGLDVARSTFIGGEATLLDLEYALLRDLDEGVDRHVTVLLDAEKFADWPALEATLRETGTERFFVAVASEEPGEATQQMFLNSTKARYVLCNRLTEAEQRTWISARVDVASDAADLMVLKARGDHYWVLNQIRKLERLKGKVDVRAVRTLCPSWGVPDFVDALLRPDKQGAFAAVAHQIPSAHDLSRAGERLGQLLRLNESVRHGGLSNRLLVERTGLSQKEISVFRPQAVYYDRKVSTKCFAALAGLHGGLARGSRDAYLSLITRW